MELDFDIDFEKSKREIIKDSVLFESSTDLSSSNIINYELNNSNITGMISVTKVKVTPDLRYARIYVSMINSNKKKTLEALKKSSGYIRTQIAHKVNLRVTPELVFELDDSMEYGAKIDSILNDLAKEIKARKEE